jgi:hypothetical protein
MESRKGKTQYLQGFGGSKRAKEKIISGRKAPENKRAAEKLQTAKPGTIRHLEATQLRKLFAPEGLEGK